MVDPNQPPDPDSLPAHVPRPTPPGQLPAHVPRPTPPGALPSHVPGVAADLGAAGGAESAGAPPRPALVRVLAPCKVNLFLEVLGRRDDGYHELVTTMLALDLADVLLVRARFSAGIELTLEGPHASADIPLDERNLVVRAARAALDEFAAREHPGTPAGLQVTLRKEVPSQAGLGGASSDAAAALRAVERLCGGDLGADFRHRTLAALGSDTIFFGEAPSGLALCEGRGERVSELPAAPDWHVLVLTPEPRCPTGAVFGALEAPGVSRADAPQRARAVAEGAARETRARLFNRLEAGALAAVPELGAYARLFEAAGEGHLRMTGSGSSFFGLFDDREAAERALARLRALAAERSLTFRAAAIARPTPLD